MAKEKKIGVSFKEINSSIYCNVNYNKMNTKFPYFIQNIDEEYEIDFVRKCVLYNISVIDNAEKFKLKGLANRIEILFFNPYTYTLIQVLDKFGDILTYNQYMKFGLDINSYSRLSMMDQVQTMLDFLNSNMIQEFEDLRKKPLLSLLPNEMMRDFVTWGVITAFEKEKELRNVDWYINPFLIDEFYDYLKTDYQSKVGFPIPTNFVVDLKNVKDNLANELRFTNDLLIMLSNPLFKNSKIDSIHKTHFKNKI